MLVEVWSDIICPWCYIGKKRFESALASVRARGFDDIDVVYRAYQLDPRAPVDAPTPAVEGYAKKFGGPERAREILAHLTATAAADGLEFRMDRALRANTLLAHRALALVAASAGTAAQTAANDALMRAYFTDGLDLGDRDVVVARCAVDGVDRESLRAQLDGDGGLDQVRSDLAGAAERGITAVPTFVIDDEFAIPGAQDVAVFENILGRLAGNRRLPEQ